MSKYAIVVNGRVTNIVQWDGTGNVFESNTVIELTDSVTANIGDAVASGVIYAKPTDGFEYTFNDTSLSWELTAAGQSAKTSAEIAAATTTKTALLESAQSTISLWQSELLLGTISDSDKSLLTNWIAYIKQLQAIDTTSLPVTWPAVPGVSG